MNLFAQSFYSDGIHDFGFFGNGYGDGYGNGYGESMPSKLIALSVAMACGRTINSTNTSPHGYGCGFKCGKHDRDNTRITANIAAPSGEGVLIWSLIRCY